MRQELSKEQLTYIIDSLHYQAATILLCMDQIKAMQEVGADRMRIAHNFFGITYSSLIYRYEIELFKLLEKENTGSIYAIANRCKENKHLFNQPEAVLALCKQSIDQLKKYSETNKHLKNRRKKTLAHNDIDYYYFSEKAIEEFPLKFDELREEALIIFHFAEQLQSQINSFRKTIRYFDEPDDVKKLFQMKTDFQKDIDSIWNSGTDTV